MSIRKRIREIEALGWRVEQTRGNHLKCTHPEASGPVFAAMTPSDHRHWANLIHSLDRALRPKPPPNS